MNKAKIESILRAVIQVVGLLVALNIGGDIVPVIGQALAFLTESLDRIFFALDELIGIGLTLYGLFSNLKKPLTLSARWKEREVGAKVIQAAALKGLSADEYLAKSA